VSVRATGTFAVAVKPLSGADAFPGRMSLEKTFEGDLAGTGTGEMLAVMTGTPGSAGYVAIERVTGTLDGRTGSFVLQHSSVMDRGVPTQSIQVVPDSGTGEIAGLRGSFVIAIDGKEHRYVFEYTLPD
jgi:hypothetical protein